MDIKKELSQNMLDGITTHAELFYADDKEKLKACMCRWSDWIAKARLLYEELADELFEQDDGDIAMRMKKCLKEIDR